MDDVLGNSIGRCRLTTEEDGQWAGWDISSLDVQILMNNIEGIHLLALVLMHALDLNVKDRIWIDSNPLMSLQVALELALVVGLDSFQLFFNQAAFLDI